jgi:dihydrofolate reductase
MEASLQDAIKYARQYETGEIFIIGGGQIFSEALPFVQKLYITHVSGDYSADTFFPEIDLSKWQAQDKEDHPGFSFVTYVKRYTSPQ